MKKLIALLLTVTTLFAMTACGTDMSSSDNGNPFPPFTGKNLEGEAVDSSLFSNYTVTVVNFWLTTCNPCVNELGELEELNSELAEKGGTVIGINAFLSEGDEQSIADAKEVLEKKGVTYSNLYFDPDTEGAEFTDSVTTFPTTYVIDQNGNIVGKAVVGSIDNAQQKEKLMKLIDEALATPAQ